MDWVFFLSQAARLCYSSRHVEHEKSKPGSLKRARVPRNTISTNQTNRDRPASGYSLSPSGQTHHKQTHAKPLPSLRWRFALEAAYSHLTAELVPPSSGRIHGTAKLIRKNWRILTQIRSWNLTTNAIIWMLTADSFPPGIANNAHNARPNLCQRKPTVWQQVNRRSVEAKRSGRAFPKPLACLGNFTCGERGEVRKVYLHTT